MRLRLALALIAYNGLRGICEALTMHLPGVRSHLWFVWYHRLRMLDMLIGAIAAILLWGWLRRQRVDHIADVSKMVLLLAGPAMLAWEAFEAAYWWARLGQATGHENVMGVWTVDGMTAVIALHATRLALGGLLTLKGGSK